MPSIRVVKVTKRFGKLVALDKVSFYVKNGEYVGILGPSGCGKTTLLKCIAGIWKQSKGHIYIGEKLVDSIPPEDRGIGYVFQNIALFPHMNVRENVGYGLRVKQVDIEESRRLVSEMIALIKFNADPHEYPRELSGGMQQKVAVARALASRTELLLLDEPLSALDALVRVELRYELKKLVKELRLTAVHITHDQEEVMSVADRIIIMKKAQVVEIGTPEGLYFRPKRLFTANFLGEANFLEGRVAGIDGDSLTLRLRGNRLIVAHPDREKGKETSRSVQDRTSERKPRMARANFVTNMLVVAAIRPEFVSVSRNTGTRPESRVNYLQGRISKLVFSGGSVRCEAYLENGDHVTCRMPIDESTEHLHVGEEITVALNADEILVYPYPRVGLQKEISLE